MKNKISYGSERGVFFTRAGSLKPFRRFCDDIGTPAAHFLSKARVPEHFFGEPENPVPLMPCYRFVDLVSRSEGIESLGLVAAEYTSLDDFGYYGQRLLESTTVFDYLNTGIRLLNTLTTGERFWMERENGVVRFCHSVPKLASNSAKLTSLFGLGVTINTLRLVCGRDWAPEQLALPCGIRQPFMQDFLADTQVVRSANYSYFTFPASFLIRTFRLGAPAGNSRRETTTQSCQLENELIPSVKQLIQLLLPFGYPDIRTLAELSGMPKRSFQRLLFEKQTSYSVLVEDVRIHQACSYLEQSDRTITDIAHELAYSDAANFTRAFRRRTGFPPSVYQTAARNPRRDEFEYDR